jgi:hypothetical protein
MRIYCQTLEKYFDSKDEMFKELKANEGKIIGLKKAAVLKSCDKGQFSPMFFASKFNDATKAALSMKEDSIYAIINTTKYIDQHDDVHFDGIWNKSLKDNQGKLYYVTDHELSFKSVVAFPKNVKSYVKMIPWSVLGKDYEGETQALIFEIKKSDIVNPDLLKAIIDGQELQNSVRMQYVIVKFGVNSDAKEYAENKIYFDSVIDSIANKEEVLSRGYLYGVHEAKIMKEGSVVLFGSNDATPILQLMNTIEPTKFTQSFISEPTPVTQKANILLNFLS